jgi:hypothetical protein
LRRGGELCSLLAKLREVLRYDGLLVPEVFP